MILVDVVLTPSIPIRGNFAHPNGFVKDSMQTVLSVVWR
jgi:hypothetical protein